MASYVTLPGDLFVPEVALQYARQAFTSSLELIQNVFSSDPNSPIQIVNPGALTEGGQYLQAPTFKRISSLVSRRDLTSFAANDLLKLTGVNDIGVLVNCKVGPLGYTPDAEYLSKASPGDISAEIGKQAGEQSLYQMQTMVISAVMGALSAMTQTLHTLNVYTLNSGAGAKNLLTPGVLTRTLALMGDMQAKIRHWLMHSQVEVDMFTDAQGRSFTGVGDVALAGNRNTNTLGRGHSVVDDANLAVAGTGSNYTTYTSLGFGTACAKIFITRPLFFYPEVQYVNTETVTRHIRGDFDFLIQIPGFGYTSSNGGANPSATVLGTTNSWTPNYTSAKEVQIVSVTHNANAA